MGDWERRENEKRCRVRVEEDREGEEALCLHTYPQSPRMQGTLVSRASVLIDCHT